MINSFIVFTEVLVEILDCAEILSVDWIGVTV